MLYSTGCLKNPNINPLWGLAQDLVAAPGSQVYVERLFSVCSDLTARKRTNKGKSGKESFPETQLCNAGQTAHGCSSQLSVTVYC